MKLSASLIVRNEASEIEGCLDSLQGVDEIVVVDTGSEDQTETLVRKWWSRQNRSVSVLQYSFLWEDDFSAARNFADSNCSGDWILTISADGRMAEGAVDKLREALSTARGRTMALWQLSRNGKEYHRRVMVRKRDSEIQWVGRVHENLSADDGETAEGVVMVYGWSDSHSYDPDRNLRILAKMAEEDPSPRASYYLGKEYMERGDMEAAEVWFRECAKNTGWRPERADAWLFCSKIAWNQHRGEEARDYCLKALANTPGCKEALEHMADMSWGPQAEIWRRYAASAGNEEVVFVRAPAVMTW